MTGRVAIIGAGMAGLAAARRLRAAGVECVVFDKSRGLGGRMATRRDGDLRFDHGAQYFTARGKRFKALVEEWRAAGAAAEWFEGAFVGVPGMSGPARAMAEGLEVAGGVQASGLRRDADGWRVLDAEGARDGAFAAVLLAVPAPQAVPLAASAGVAFPALEAVRYAPCWALMLTFDGPSGLTEDHRRFESGAISWIARNGSKPGRDPAPETLVGHAVAGLVARSSGDVARRTRRRRFVAELPGVGSDGRRRSTRRRIAGATRWSNARRRRRISGTRRRGSGPAATGASGRASRPRSTAATGSGRRSRRRSPSRAGRPGPPRRGGAPAASG